MQNVTSPSIRLHLLGGVSLEFEGMSDNARVLQRRPLAVLALTAGTHPRPADRDWVATMLWPESDETRARNSLRQALYHIRSDLGDDVFLEDTSNRLALNPSRIDVDLWRFRDALENNRLEIAAEVWGGGFMEEFRLPGAGEMEEWVDGVQRELRLSHIETLDALGRRAAAEGRLDDAVQLRRKLAAVNPLSSRVALSLLRALNDAGDRTGALQYASVYEALVRDRLDVDVDDTVSAFVERLRTEPAPLPPDPSARTLAPPAAATSEPRTAYPAAPESDTSAVAPPQAAHVQARGVPSLWAQAVIGLTLLSVGVSVGRAWPDSAVPVGTSEASGAVPEEVVEAAFPSEVIVVGSGTRVSGGRDQRVRLVECKGTGCPEGELPQFAYAVPKHPAHDAPMQGSAYISPIPEGTVAGDLGIGCCTRAVFETEFDLPSRAVSARITLSVLADNQAIVELNGVEIGRQPDIESQVNFAGPATTIEEVFLPAQGGPNVVRVILEDLGGAIALNFYGFVTWQAGG